MLFSLGPPELWGFDYTPTNHQRNSNTRGPLIVQAYER